MQKRAGEPEGMQLTARVALCGGSPIKMRLTKAHQLIISDHPGRYCLLHWLVPP